MIGTLIKGALSLASSVGGGILRNRGRKTELEYQERSSGWKDEYAVVTCLVWLNVFLIGFLVDPLLMWIFEGITSPPFETAAQKYVDLIVSVLGPGGFQAVVIGALSLAGIQGVGKAWKQRDKAIEKQGEKKSTALPPSWRNK